MLDKMESLRRTHYMTQLCLFSVSQEVVVAGFVHRHRDKGNLIFIDLRDRTGLLQLTFNDKTDVNVFKKAKTIKIESVLMVKGIVTKREMPNTELKTGDIELFVTELKILSISQTPPFHINDSSKISDEIALKYRYLDLRREKLQENLIMRHNIARVTREYFYKNDFIEIETPIMMKSTPEGARDYLVPSRIHKGHFYALPQSPQIYKQLLMIAGYDRYIQLARCFRDEDLRADRQPEFTQIDLEMSYVDIDDILKIIEGYVKYLFKEIIGHDVVLPIKRLTYDDAINIYGSDKPDTRFDMHITDISSLVSECEFPVFKNALSCNGTVRAIVAKSAATKLTRKEIDKLIEYVKGIGAGGMGYIRYIDNTPNCSFGKFLKDDEMNNILKSIDCVDGDVAFFIADKTKTTLSVLGSLRTVLAKKLDIIPKSFNFVWITEFPFFDYDDTTGNYVAMHHPFTMPMDDSLSILESDKSNVKAKAYDLVLNGTELSSGSIRINDFELQQKMFETLGLSKDEIESKFGFLVNAYRYGAPPHGGMGIGLDRIAMILCDCESLKDVTAFPKVQNASELMSECPSVVDDVQLKELHIDIMNNNI